MATLKIMDRTGHTELKYELKDKKSMQAAEQKFGEMQEQGYTSYITLEDGAHVKVNTFQEDRDTYMVPPVMGG